MWHLRRAVQTHRRPFGIALGLVLLLGLGLTGCARSAPVSLLPDQIQTLHQDREAWMWADGSCPTSLPPPVHAASGDQALVGAVSWPSGGQAGYECATTFRFYMAGVHFSLQGVAWGATTHAQLTFRLAGLEEPLMQASDCVVQLSVAKQEWSQEDPTQVLTDPYAVLHPGNLSAIGAGSAHQVAYDSRTQTVTVDATAAVSDWIVQRQPNQGFLFTSPFNSPAGGCRLIRLSSVALLFSHG
jgi:hypothetical protein